MYFLDNNSGIATMPPLKETQSTTPLWFTEGDGNKGISWPGEDWFNIQQAEQLALLDAAGIRPDKGKLNQLTLAIRAIIGQEALLKTQALAEIAAAGKTAQEKARTHLGLGKLATQDGIQEATLHRKGIVQLNSAPRSADETTAATPKAVNDRVNAVVDNAPSDLDTLNKLAQAISNNPKFAESVTQLLSQKLAKNENGADIPDKNLFLKNLGLTETVDCAKNALDKRTGGTVNGDIISQGTQITLKGDNRKHLGFHNQDGSVRMWIYKDKGDDGVRLNNGNDGGGEYIFHKDGGFRAPAFVYAGAAKMASDGNLYGSMWGNQWLNVYLRNTFQPKGAYSKPNTAKREVNGWWKCGDTGLIIQWARYGKDKGEGTYDFPLPMKFPNAGLFCLGYVGTALDYGADFQSQSAHLVDKATVRVTIDNGLETVVLAIGF